VEAVRPQSEEALLDHRHGFSFVLADSHPNVGRPDWPRAYPVCVAILIDEKRCDAAAGPQQCECFCKSPARTLASVLIFWLISGLPGKPQS
ncbi:MAG: hypothetical protein WA579_04055, partial [Rhodomicrobium sp.]